MFRDLFETFGANSLLTVFGLFTSIIIARILGPEMRGELAVILLWSGLFSTFASLGINESLGYFSGEKSHGKWKYLYTSLVLGLVISLLLITPLVFSITFLMKSYSVKTIQLGMLSVGFSVFFIPQFMTAQSFLQGSGLIRHLNLINLSNGLLYFFFILAIWIFLPRGSNDLALTIIAYIGTFLILCFVSYTLLITLKGGGRHFS